MVHSVTVVICIYCILTVYSSDAAASKRWKKDVAGLVSFPRIGREDQQWKTGTRALRRQSLVSFPRTGKRESVDDAEGNEVPEPPGTWQSEQKESSSGRVWAVVQVKDLPVVLMRPSREDSARAPGEDAVAESL